MSPSIEILVGNEKIIRFSFGFFIEIGYFCDAFCVCLVTVLGKYSDKIELLT